MNINKYIEERIAYWESKLRDNDKYVAIYASVALNELKLLQDQLKEKQNG